MENGIEIPVWNVEDARMEWNGRFKVWNGMEHFKNGMEDNLPYFHTNSILDFALGIHRKVYATSDKKCFHQSF